MTSTRTTPAQRAHASEQRRIAAGGRNLRLVLSPEANAALQAIQSASGMTARAAIEHALARAAPRK